MLRSQKDRPPTHTRQWQVKLTNGIGLKFLRFSLQRSFWKRIGGQND